jgi:bifunctional DNase/RNase
MIEVDIKKIITTPTAGAVFLGNESKTFVIYVGASISMAIAMTMENVKKARPLTHDLLSSVLAGLDVHVEKVVINALRGSTFYARLYLQEEGFDGKRIVELDARPSDCMVIAKQNKAPIYVEEGVFDSVEDVSGLLKKIEKGDSFEVE